MIDWRNVWHVVGPALGKLLVTVLIFFIITEIINMAGPTPEEEQQLRTADMSVTEIADRLNKLYDIYHKNHKRLAEEGKFEELEYLEHSITRYEHILQLNLDRRQKTYERVKNDG